VEGREQGREEGRKESASGTRNADYQFLSESCSSEECIGDFNTAQLASGQQFDELFRAGLANLYLRWTEV
jgi:hypothetical protein